VIFNHGIKLQRIDHPHRTVMGLRISAKRLSKRISSGW
jgi:hypothetical protein